MLQTEDQIEVELLSLVLTAPIRSKSDPCRVVMQFCTSASHTIAKHLVQRVGNHANFIGWIFPPLLLRLEIFLQNEIFRIFEIEFV